MKKLNYILAIIVIGLVVAWYIKGKNHLNPKDTAIIVVDLQGDFTTAKKGALAVPEADENYLQHVQKFVNNMRDKGYQIVFTQDWHPKNHTSFARNHGKNPKLPPEMITLKRKDGTKYQQEMWPTHCVQGTENARILLDIKEGDILQQKGTRKAYDSYSGFEDAGQQPTGLADKLKARGINNIIVLGLATDYCVKFTALDGVKSGFNVTFVDDLSRAIVDGAGVDEMIKAGVSKVQSKTF